MDKNYEAIKEILEEQIKKIVKKGDITPQELDSLYKASAICLDFETKEAMKKAEKKSEGGYSQDGSPHDGNSNRGYANDGYSTHYPWFMPGFRSFDGSSYFDGSHDMQSHRNGGHYSGNSYEQSNRGGYDGRGSYDSSYDGASYRRGRDATTGRYVSRDGSYDYSRHEEREHMLDRLESMLDNASTEKDRRAIEQCIERISR